MPARFSNMANVNVGRIREMHQMNGLAGTENMTPDRVMAIKQSYLRFLARTEPASKEPLPPGSDPAVAEAHNNLAWLMATSNAVDLREPAAAVAHVRQAVHITPNQGTFWNTLGAALYRVGDLDGAKQALERSMALRNGGKGDSFDWFFLAMIDAKQGRKEDALEWYEKAIQWFRQARPADHELFRFQIEAAEQLGLPAPAPPPLPSHSEIRAKRGRL